MFICSSCKSTTSQQEVASQQVISSKPTTRDYEQLIKDTYAENIINSIKYYYGEDRDYTNLVIKHIEIGYLTDIITFEFNTFYGAHNPPYALDTVTYEVSYKGQKLIIKEIDYTHEPIEDLPSVSSFLHLF